MAETTLQEPKRRHRWWRWVLWIFAFILILPVIAVLVLQLDSVQDFLRRKGQDYLQHKLQTKVTIGYVHARGWDYLELRNVYVGDRANQPLFYTASLKVHYNLLSLLNKELRINKVEWDSLRINVYRHARDTAFNYQFAVDAFSSPSPTVDTTTGGTSITFHVRDVNLTHATLNMMDEAGGLNAQAQWDTLYINPDDLLLNDGLYTFRDITVAGLGGQFKQAYLPKTITSAAPPPSPRDSATERTTPFHLIVKNFKVRNSAFAYGDEGSGVGADFALRSFRAADVNFDKDAAKILLGTITLDSAKGNVVLDIPKDTVVAKTPAAAAPTVNWHVTVSEAGITRTALKYDNGHPIEVKTGGDPNYNHLDLSGFNTRVTDIHYSADTIAAVLHQLSVQDKTGFTIRKATMDMLFTPTQLRLRDLWLQTNQSLLRKYIAVTVPSWSTISQQMNRLQLEALLDSSHIALGEWLPFVPDARKNKYMQPLFRKQLDLHAVLKGNMEHLVIDNLYAADNDGNVIKTAGSADHVTDAKNIAAALPMLYVQTGNKAIRSWLPPHTMPDSIRLPENMIITGNFFGGLEDLKTKLDVRSDIANASIHAHLVHIMDSIRAVYDVQIPHFHVNPGVMIYSPEIGWIDGNLFASGQGYVMSRMQAKAGLHVIDATYNKYTYHDVSLTGDVDNGAFNMQGQSNDTAMLLDFTGSGQLSDSALDALKASMHLLHADFYTTHLYHDTLLLKGNLDADFSSLHPDRIIGNAYLTGWQLGLHNVIYPIDTVLLTAGYTDMQHVNLDGPFGYFHTWGHADYREFGKLGIMVQRPVMPADTASKFVAPTGQLIGWDAALSIPRSLQPLVPGINIPTPVQFSGHLNSDSSLLDARLYVPTIRYDSLVADSLQLTAHEVDSTLDAKVTLASLQSKFTPLYHTEIDAHANGGIIDWRLLLDDMAQKPRYDVAGQVRLLPDSVTEISLKPNMLLNRLRWQVDENNMVRLKNSQPDSINLKLNQGAQSIAVVTQHEADANVPALDATIKDFQLATLTGMASKDTLLAAGTLNAAAHISQWDLSPKVHAKLKVDSLAVLNTAVGTLNATVETEQANQYKLDATIQGNENDVKLAGTYDSTINATLDINNLSMKSIQPFTMGNVSNMKGSARGHFDITGTAAAPKILGQVHFDNAGGTIVYTGTPLTLPDEDIVIDENGILFNKLVVQDSTQNELVVDGRINTKNFQQYRFNLTVDASDFMILGKQQNPDQPYYGPAYIDTHVRLRGDMNLPRVDMSMKLLDKSQVNITLPASEVSASNREGVIVFVDKDNPIDSSLARGKDTTARAGFKGVAFNGTIEIDPKAAIKIVIDPQNGDYVTAKGTASLNTSMDPSNALGVTGRYEISEGKYEMSLNQLIKRSFDIQKGSYINFNGDPMNADLDITAKYTVNTSAINILEDQIGGATGAARNQYLQKLPIEVYMEIKGNLKQPEITFRLDMPAKDQGAFNGMVYARLKQINTVESDLNKQVMALLVLNTFLADDPLSSLDNGGGGVDQMARQSASKLISQQLNNFAGNLIKGIDLNFDLQSSQDYTTGQAQDNTMLNVSASKQLFNDRLKVTAGSNVMLEGSNQAASSLIGDISVEYQITKDGRYRIRVYQTNLNDVTIQGQVIETGVAFVLVVDYDHFREIFQRAAKEKEAKRLRQQQQADKKLIDKQAQQPPPPPPAKQ
ncbi:translocation/assembly module TamB domain-containing protein [Chitinophaga parva]|uniref:translocation/assembly module TamB domain-containing protein n=1 Tax=Chitinophaga parva TaxID=2169414 RepID=UPI000D3ECB01|nr:translocation/assembly module TamB [Chitinophaga parva]